MFLDDGFGCGADFEETETRSSEIKKVLLLYSFILIEHKSIWIPVQIMEYWGIVLKSIFGIIYIPDCRLTKAN